MSDENPEGSNAYAAMRNDLKTANERAEGLATEIARLVPFEAEARRLAPFEAQATELGSSSTDLAKQVADLTSQIGTMTSDHASSLHMAHKGFDASGALVARALHAAAGADAGPIDAWLDGMTAESAPKPLRPYFAAGGTVAEPAPPGDSPGAPISPVTAPRPGALATPNTPVAPAVPLGAIPEATARAQKSGDWSEVKALTAASRAQMSRE